MIPWILYLAITGFAGGILSTIFNLFRKDADKGSMGIVCFCLPLAIIAPFAFAETITRSVGDSMKKVIDEAYENSKIDGPMRYFRVTRYTGSHATAIVVGEEKDGWEGKDRPILEVQLKKTEKDTWKVESTALIHSLKEGSESFVFPPYH